MLGPLSPHDIEVFIVCRRLKVSRDHIEFRIGCPRRAGWEHRTALSQPTFTEVVRGIDAGQFVLVVGAAAEPCLGTAPRPLARLLQPASFPPKPLASAQKPTSPRQPAGLCAFTAGSSLPPARYQPQIARPGSFNPELCAGLLHSVILHGRH